MGSNPTLSAIPLSLDDKQPPRIVKERSAHDIPLFLDDEGTSLYGEEVLLYDKGTLLYDEEVLLYDEGQFLADIPDLLVSEKIHRRQCEIYPVETRHFSR